ncbi:hypothetical protein GCM10009102_28700 [Sphingomonas insulae]|uniref:Uncharacterized protein n=1 Tax=Sphingomonas insulae TaxID=424800 RepID=A0ABN1HZ28_9SPHN
MAKCGRNSETTRLIATLHYQGEWFAASLARQLDRPAWSAHAGDLEARRGSAGDPPAGPGRGWLAQWILVAGSPATQEKHGHISLGCDKLEAAGCHHRHPPRLRDDR